MQDKPARGLYSDPNPGAGPVLLTSSSIMNWPVQKIQGMDTGWRTRFRAQRNDCEEDRKLYSRRTRVRAGAGLNGCVAEEALTTCFIVA